MALDSSTVDWLQLFSVVNVVLFAGLMVYGAASASARLARYRLAGQAPPKLLWRDVGMIVSWAALIILILAIRALRILGIEQILWIDIGPGVVDDAWWVVLTGLLATAGAWIFVVYERRMEREDLPKKEE